MNENLPSIAHVLYSFGTGGMESIIATCIRLSSNLFNHRIICLTRAGESADLLPPDVEIFELHKPPGNSLSFIWFLSRRLKTLGPDIVHTYNWSGMDAVLAARLGGISRIVHSEHGWDMDDPQGLNRKRCFIRRLFCRWVTECTCVSQQMVSWLERDVQVPCPVTHIYNGVDAGRYRPGNGGKIRSELGIALDSFVVGIVSRLDPIKNHLLLFKAFKKLRAKFPGSHLLVVGDGPERDRLSARAGSGIHFLGDRRDVPEILRALDVFVLSSLNEGISCAITEAMATGLPIIASRVGGNVELVEHGKTGMLFESGKEEKLYDGLVKYYLNRELARQHGMAGRNKMISSFSNEVMVRQYIDLYERLLVGNGGQI